jgi:hypothetical protein
MYIGCVSDGVSGTVVHDPLMCFATNVDFDMVISRIHGEFECGKDMNLPRKTI